MYIVTCPLTARIVEPEKIPTARQWLCINTFPQQPNHMTAAKDTHATVEGLLEAVFSVESVLRLYAGN